MGNDSTKMLTNTEKAIICCVCGIPLIGVMPCLLNTTTATPFGIYSMIGVITTIATTCVLISRKL